MPEDKQESSPFDLNYNCYSKLSIPKEYFELNLGQPCQIQSWNNIPGVVSSKMGQKQKAHQVCRW